MRSKTLVLMTAALAVSALLAACAGSYHIQTDAHDDGSIDYVLTNNEITVEGAAKYHAELNEFDDGNYMVEKRCYIDVRAHRSAEGTVEYWLILTYIAKDWLEIEKGRSLELAIDRNEKVLTADSDLNREMDPSGDFITEILEYPVDSDLLWRMVRAQAILVNITGRQGEAKGYFNETNFANLRRFAKDHMEVSTFY